MILSVEDNSHGTICFGKVKGVLRSGDMACKITNSKYN